MRTNPYGSKANICRRLSIRVIYLALTSLEQAGECGGGRWGVYAHKCGAYCPHDGLTLKKSHRWVVNTFPPLHKMGLAKRRLPPVVLGCEAKGRRNGSYIYSVTGRGKKWLAAYRDQNV